MDDQGSSIMDDRERLIRHLDRLHARDQSFAKSLLQAAFPSATQRGWIAKLAARCEPQPLVPILNSDAIRQFLNNAPKRMLRPGIEFYSGLTLKVQRVGTRIEISANDVFVGWLDDGYFDPRTPDVDRVAIVLQAFANDPVAMVRAHGRRTGRCCFCGLSLSDARSVEHGYGPICAKQWQLPWRGPVEDDNKPHSAHVIDLPPPARAPIVQSSTIQDAVTKRIAKFDYKVEFPKGIGHIEVEVPSNWLIVPRSWDTDIRERLADFCSMIGANVEGEWKTPTVRYAAPSGRKSKRTWKLFVLRFSEVSDCVMVSMKFNTEVF